MLQSVINALKVKDIRRKVYMMLLLLLVFRIGCFIPVPGLVRDTFAAEIQGNAGFETAVGGLDIAIPVVDADDDGIGGCIIVVHKIHSVSFLPLCGNTKLIGFGGGHFDHHHLK